MWLTNLVRSWLPVSSRIDLCALTRSAGHVKAKNGGGTLEEGFHRNIHLGLALVHHRVTIACQVARMISRWGEIKLAGIENRIIVRR
jgi:hypothetical protein